MCVNMKRYYNKWQRCWNYSPCGHCPACLQSKAFKRTKRIKNATYNGYIYLFVTLTYNNACVPYLKREELHDNVSHINIYRDFVFRRVRVASSDSESHTYQMVYKGYRNHEPISTIDCIDFNFIVSEDEVRKVPNLKRKKGCIGICYYKDIQDFEKRLRTNLVRRFNVSEPIYTFKVTEYGPTTIRPHAHLLIAVPAAKLSECQQAISESWQYDSKDKLSRQIEIARNASSYVSAYVNRGSDFPTFLSARPFVSKCSFSKHFGCQNPKFSLDYILAQIRQGDMRYLTTRNRNDSTESALVVFPKYALDRYFVRFKGYSRLSRSEAFKLLRDPAWLYHVTCERLIRDKLLMVDEFDEIDWNQVNQAYVSIVHHYHRFIADFPIYEDGELIGRGLPDNIWNRSLYAQYFIDCWSSYNNTIYRAQFDECRTLEDVAQCYYNLEDVRSLNIKTDLMPFLDKHEEISEPNLFWNNIKHTYNMTDIYFATKKRRKITNHVMSVNKINV